MPRKHVFPGGAVDAADAGARLTGALSRHCLRRLADRGGADPRTLAAAAIRELWEETGLALAIPRADATQGPAGEGGTVVPGVQVQPDGRRGGPGARRLPDGPPATVLPGMTGGAGGPRMTVAREDPGTTLQAAGPERSDEGGTTGGRPRTDGPERMDGPQVQRRTGTTRAGLATNAPGNEDTASGLGAISPGDADSACTPSGGNSDTAVAAGAAPHLREPDPAWAGLAARGLVPCIDGLAFLFRAITPAGGTRRFDARFFLVPASRIHGDSDDFTAASDELSDLRWIGLAEARALDLPFVTRVVLAEAAHAINHGPDPAGVPFFDNAGPVPAFHRLA